VKYVRLYSDEGGDSHFEDVGVRFESVDYAPPAPPLDLSSSTPASQFLFARAPSGWHGDWHPTPRRQFFCCLAGEIEVTASDGETRLFLPGDVLLLEDTTGKGHKSKVTSEEDLIFAVVQLAD
jgi:quercetin dioxygenase-like cupin family protein